MNHYLETEFPGKEAWHTELVDSTELAMISLQVTDYFVVKEKTTHAVSALNPSSQLHSPLFFLIHVL